MTWVQCDQCSARAMLYAFKIINLYSTPNLYFCGFHARLNKKALKGDGWLLSALEAADVYEEEDKLSDWIKEITDV